MAVIKKFRIKNFKKLNPSVSFEKISFSYDERLILDNISLQLNPGEIMGMLGPNGVGKSTIFNLIIGLVKPNFGKIFFGKEDGTDYPIHKRTRMFNIGYVPQYGGYFHDLTLVENFGIVGQILIKNAKERELKINELISKFELDNARHVKTKFLSGGQRRKLVICMALLGQPKILLCDEIFAALDILSIQMLKEIIINLQRERPEMSIVICEHQARELLSIVDKAMILSDCKIIAQGSPHELLNNQKARNSYFGEAFKR